jgi:hypothetical protein
MHDMGTKFTKVSHIPSKKAAKKLFRDEVITNDDAAGSTDVDAE